MHSRLSAVLVLLLVVGATGALPVEARITRIEITRVESPTFDGASFGAVGQFEKLIGVAFGEVDPGRPLNAYPGH